MTFRTCLDVNDLSVAHYGKKCMAFGIKYRERVVSVQSVTFLESMKKNQRTGKSMKP
ncbi:hypothetical protein MPTK1_2g23190 [Marchantia polymorpha subsp. ruderalis]|uniref:Uncharacterized protein n=1 Tax=Marchantia polymorpha TaxID=3197 RepID=A0A2R6WN15_MARPO|nr:hypothetical protein MARPO_0072s0012 [Marchantia polymorpha]BBN03403.1 hypothetical protein Mp_2g23190 [Marchantia polymorpha subsp. ruderalis]|eukprot:PTQ35248.1 hypothetical protein MARPO_0072s0012 [Marchantia polymorpha]